MNYSSSFIPSEERKGMMHLFMIMFFFAINFVKADTQLSLSGSLLYTNPDTNDLSGTTVTDEYSGLGGGLGMRALLELKDQLHFRSGASIIQKRFGFETQGIGKNVNKDFSLIYLNLPLTFYWKASPQIGFFGGTALNAKLSDDCHESGGSHSCTSNKIKAVVFPAIVGFDFYLMEKLGLELSYEYGLTETAKDLKVHSAVASLLFHID
jgi:hypothetical protein